MKSVYWPTGRRAPLPPVADWSGATEILIAGANAEWQTPAEAEDFKTTPDYRTTILYLERLVAASDLVRLNTYGTSAEGRPLFLVSASTDHTNASAPPQDAARPRVLVECGIHPGEIDGKDAGLMLLRDIAFNNRQDLIENCDLFFVPVVNPDGHERISPFSRPNQRGPEQQGWRASAQGLNLNRDFMKADSPEIRAILALIGRIEPDLFIDIHVTDGLDYQYDITYGFQDRPYAASPAANAWLHEVFQPAVNAAMRDLGHIPGPLILARDDRKPELGLMLPAFPPRFSHGYGDLRHMPTVLVENHSLKPVRQRILGTYAFLSAALETVARSANSLRDAKREDRSRRNPEPVLTWAMTDDPVRYIEFHGVDSEFYKSPASGADEVRWLGNALPPVLTPVFGSRPALVTARPKGYWVPRSETEVIERLGLHGIEFDISEGAVSVEVEMIRLADLEVATQVSERRVALAADCSAFERRVENFVAGSAFVPTDQPLGDLAIHMLEPASPDSLFRYGMISGMLDPTEYLEAYVIAPMAEEMLASDPELKLDFEKRLAGDPEFAGDPAARLKWFYLRSPYRDERHMLYPVGRVPA